MKRWLLTLCLTSMYLTSIGLAQDDLYKDASQPVEARVANLLSQMTLAEKVGQMTQINVARIMGDGEWDRGPLNDDWLRIIFEENQVGSILSGGGAAPIPNTPQAWAEMTNQLQDAALRYSRLDIPYIYGIDAVHGHNNVQGATIYPHNIGLAATWNLDLVEQVSARVAQDVHAVGTHWTFAPVADVARDPRWGRFYESFGEDPMLTSRMVAASVRGFQTSGQVAATVKHFGGYGQALVGFDRSPAFLDTRSLRTVHFPSFQAGISEGAMAMMANSGAVNGVPVHASPMVLQDIARGDMGFDGVLISDWEDILKLVTVHKVASDFEEAVAMSINAGINMYMVPHDASGFTSTLIELVEAGIVPMSRIDNAVTNILTLKMELGLFEAPFVDADLADGIVIEQERTLAKQAAQESITLLENSGVLPLAEDSNVFVVGPSADSIANQMGGWTIGWQGLSDNGERPPGLTVLEALEQTAPPSASVTYTSLYRSTDTLQTMTAEADVVVAVVGEPPYAEGEGDSDTISLDALQLDMLRTLMDIDAPVVVVLLAGRPLILPEDIWLGLDALVMAYLPGSEAGTALTDVLFGRYTPSGRLPFSWPRHTGQLPLAYDVLPNAPYDPLYEFGYGLSYTTFRTQNLTASLEADSIQLSIEVSNTGEVTGSEVVQAFVSYPPVGVLTPVHKLVGFDKVRLEPGETQTVTLEIPTTQFAIIPGDILGNAPFTVMPGQYRFQIDDARVQVTLP
ncbi:MAG: glycoside hydrolase family 3 N-terminal domain-containing protein [Deinococcota bacterium]